MFTFMGCLLVGMLACALLVSLLVGLLAVLPLGGIILVMVTSVLAAILV